MGDVELLRKAHDARGRIVDAIGRTIVGQTEVIDLMLITLLARGHALLVGVPGLAKTLLVSTLASSLDLTFGRVQFTPDLLPADITGTDAVLDEADPAGNVHRRVRFLPGPIFHNLVLADEINRTPPKTQSALLQAMQERSVTVGTSTHALPNPFQVFATRNPIEQEGTYVLPEAQLDRFLLEVHVSYPSESDEREIARRNSSPKTIDVTRVLTTQELLELQDLVPRIPVTDAAVALAVSLTRATRPETGDDFIKQYVRFGAGPRGSLSLVLAAKARAALSGQAAADIDDVIALTPAVLRHRMVLSYRAEAEGQCDVDIVSHALKRTHL